MKTAFGPLKQGAVFLALVLLVAVAPARELKPYPEGATPPLALQDLHGKLHPLKDYRGRVVLINFWATWCPPCRAEMPSMQRLKDKLTGQPFTILAVDMGESEEAVQGFLKEIPVNFTILLDKDGSALKAWKVFAFPTSFLVDKKGAVRYATFGAKEWDDADALSKIDELLSEPVK